VVGLPQVKVQAGELANLSLIDPEEVWTVETSRLRSKSKNSPFGGMSLTGRAIGIVHHGQMYRRSS
jgi:dihydroorotase